MNRARTSEISGMPKVSTAIVTAIKNTSQKTNLPSIESGVCWVCDLSKNCLMPPFSIQPSKPVPWSPDYVRDKLYMVPREGVRNAVAHSGSDRITAVVRDHGGGFETGEPAGEGLGLRSMEGRASLLGGTFSLGPDPEGRARAVVRLPFAKERGA